MGKKKKVKPGIIELHPLESMIIVNYEMQIEFVDDNGNCQITEKQQSHKKIKIKSFTANSNVKKVAKSIIEHCKYIPQSKEDHIISLLDQLKQRITPTATNNNNNSEDQKYAQLQLQLEKERNLRLQKQKELEKERKRLNEEKLKKEKEEEIKKQKLLKKQEAELESEKQAKKMAQEKKKLEKLEKKQKKKTKKINETTIKN